MGDRSAPSTQESTGDVLQAVNANFPALMQTYNDSVAPTSQAQLDASKSISPQYQELLTNLYKTYGPQVAQTGSDIDAQTRLATAKTDASILAGPGKDIADAYKSIDTELNPEYYATRSAASKSIGDLLKAGDISQPNVEAERLVNQENIRSGNIANPNATNTVSNAIQFGNEGIKRQQNLASSIATATNFLSPSSNAQFNPATAALNKPTSNTGTSQFGGVTPAATQSYNSGQGLLSASTGLQQSAQDINANRRDVLDRLTGVANSL